LNSDKATESLLALTIVLGALAELARYVHGRLDEPKLDELHRLIADQLRSVGDAVKDDIVESPDGLADFSAEWPGVIPDESYVILELLERAKNYAQEQRRVKTEVEWYQLTLQRRAKSGRNGTS
jgi:hypothetical protein